MVLVTAEIIDLGLNMILDASSDEVHFVRGFLQAPASIDLSNIRWITNEEVYFDLGDDGYSLDDLAFSEDDEYKTPVPSFDGSSILEPEVSSEADTSGFLDELPTEPPTLPFEEEGESTTEGNDEEDESEGDEEEEDNEVDEVTESETPPDDEDTEEETIEEGTDEDNEGEEEPPEEEDVVEDEEEGGEADEEDDNGEDGGEEEESTPESPEDGGDDVDEEVEEKGEEETNEEEKDEVEGAPIEEEENAEEETNEEEKDEKEEPPVEEEENTEEETNEEEKDEVEEPPVEEEENTEEETNEEEKGGKEEPPVEEEETNEKEEPPVEEEENAEEETNEEDNDEVEEEEIIPTDAPTGAPTEDGGDRSLRERSTAAETQIVDISLFLIPSKCKLDKYGVCDWVALGVGAYDDEMEGGMSYCCSEDTAGRGICNSDHIGQLMINHDVFEGDHRQLVVPSQPLEDFAMDDPFFEVTKSGDYVLVLANCNDDGFGIITLGNMEWKSKGGYLPGDMFGLMFFFGAATAIYLVLMLWYYYGMKMFQQGAVPIQKYILGTIVLGFLATAFQGVDLLYWNIEGTRSDVVMYIAIALGILYQGSLRCLGVMVAMGWGVVRDSLGLALCKIILLGLVYCGLTLVRELLNAVAMSAGLVSSTKEEELFDLSVVLSLVITCVNIIFYCWIISSVRTTTEYLRNMNQTSKLRRHLRLRCLIITSMVIIIVLTTVHALQMLAILLPKISDMDDYPFSPFLTPDQMWIITAVGQGNYLFILFGVTILWMPNADAKDYAMSMQIPAMADDENDLELSCVVPSADDMDGYKIDDAVHT